MSSDNLLLNDSLDFIPTTTIQGVFWGINLSLYFLCAQLFCSQYRKTPNDWNKFILPFICNSVMVVTAGLELASGTRVIQFGYINNGGVNGEPDKFFGSLPVTSALDLISVTPSFVISILNSVVQLRRLWIIWVMSPYRLSLAVSLILLLIVFQGIQVFCYIIPVVKGTPGKVFRILSPILFAVNLAFTLLVTLLLVGRIIVMQRRNNRLMGTSENAKQHTNIVAILIESYALDSIWTLATMITFALSSGGNPVHILDIFNYSADQVTVIAFLLVNYRVLLGRAWTPETGTQLSSLQWNHSDPEATRTTNQITSVGHPPPITMGSHTVADENSFLA